MKQEYDSLLEAFSKMSGEEIVAYFDGLGFIDEIGHPLKNCLKLPTKKYHIFPR